MERIDYDEFAYFSQNAKEYGIKCELPPKVKRISTQVDSHRQVSSLIWGDTAPEIVFLHGGAQNAHTWDSVALALNRPLLTIDMPGHGHSDAGSHGSLSVKHLATDITKVIEALAPTAKSLVGMSLGGLTALAALAQRSDLVQSLVLIDITPGVNREKAAPITSFISGPSRFSDFEKILAHTVEHNPTRSVESLKRGILHNAIQLEDGSWVWRYARFRENENIHDERPEFGDLWNAISNLDKPLMLVVGGSWSVVDEKDKAELLRRKPDSRIEHVPGAGHSIQGDQPVALARLLDDFLQEVSKSANRPSAY